MKSACQSYQIVLLFLISMGTFLASGCRDSLNECLSGKGPVVSKRIGLYSFKNVKVRDNISLEIVNDNSFEMEVTAGKNLVEGLGLQIINNTLNIRNSSTCPIFKDPWNPIAVRLSVPDLDTIFVENQADIVNSAPFETDNLVIIILESPSNIKMEVDCEYLRIGNQNGTGDIKILGQAQIAEYYHAAYGTVDLRYLECNELIINSVSSNHCYVRAGRDYLFAIVGGSGNIYYQFDPSRLDLKQEGTGKLIKIY